MKKILLFLVVVSLIIPFVPANAEDNVINDENIINLIVGEEKKISDDISLKLIKLMEVEGNALCTKTNLEPCLSYIEIKMGNMSKSTVITMENFYPISSFYPTISSDFKIGLIGKKDYQTGIFEIQKEGLISSVSELEQEITPSSPKPILESDISEPISYQTIKPQIGIKESITISSDQISIYNEEKETETIYNAPTSVEETKTAIKIEVGDIESGKREINIKPVRDKLILEMVKGATNEDCEMYSSECKKGDEILCQKYDFNCSNLEKQTCENYLLSCKKGNEDACVKWDLNCKQKEVTPEFCGKILSLCQDGLIERCKEYNVSCQQKEIVSVSTKEVLNIKENKIFMNEKEIKVMPDTASESAIDKLSLNKDVEIELKDTGKPVYEVIGSQEKRILGLFKTAVKVTTTLSAETGEIEKTKKPWWSFLAW